MPSPDAEEAEERYRRLVEHSPDGICISHEGRIVFANSALARMLGAKDVSEILGRTYDEAVHPDSLPLVEERIAHAKAGEVMPWIEEKWLRLDGSVVYVEAAAVPVVLHGEVLVQLFTRDLTERKRAEAALEEQRQRLQALFDLSIDAIILVDDEGHYIDVNQAAAKLFGYSREELLRMKVGDLTPGENREDLKAIWREVFAGASIQTIHVGATKGGDRLILKLQTLGHVTPGLNYSIIHDITEQKQAEESLRRLSLGLLRSQDEERRRISRQLHETIAQSLAALRMNLSRLADAHSSEVVADSMQLVEQSIREIRTLSYLLHPPLMEELGLVATLEWYASGFAQRSGVAVSVEAGADVGRLPAEIETTVFRVVQEALTNIHRHSESAEAIIRLRRDDGELFLEIADRGRGFALGTTAGVGLTGIHERVMDLRGTMDIHSGDDGTTITVRLPI